MFKKGSKYNKLERHHLRTKIMLANGAIFEKKRKSFMAVWVIS